MLKFLRDYQWYFFLFITVIIVITFSFFGTYDRLPVGTSHEETVFVALDGSRVTGAELNAMVTFLKTDDLDKQLSGGIWGPNFLNDGVIRDDFLLSGLAELVATTYSTELTNDLETRLVKEKRYTPYVHPQAKFISAENAWNYLVPQLKSKLDLLKKSEDPTSKEALQARIALYILEKRFPAPSLRQMLQYQEQQYDWVRPDPRLNQIDLSLFGYHSVEDWFGSRFLNIVSQIVINGAKEAEKRGYQVTRKEALSDLIAHANQSYQYNRQNPRLGVANVNEYFNGQLRHMGMDRTMAAKVWRQVMLFRRLFQDVGNGAFLDPVMFESFNTYTHAQVSGDLFQLQRPLRFQRYEQLQNFEFYLSAVSGRDQSDQALLKLPNTFHSAVVVAKTAPELVQKRYLVKMASMKKKDLNSKVSLKETWNWELGESNWKELVHQFPEFSLKEETTRAARTQALDALDNVSRSRVDAWARGRIVDAHPEWIDQALADAETEERIIHLRKRGGKFLFSGMKNGTELMELLDQAPIGELTEALSQFSADDATYYQMIVLDRSQEREVMTFAEAEEAGVLDEMLERKLQTYYLEVRKEHPARFQKGDGAWRDFKEVRHAVADLYFAPVIKAIEQDTLNQGREKVENWTGQVATPFRFYAYMRQMQKQYREDPEAVAEETARTMDESAMIKETFDQRPPLSEMWKLTSHDYQVERSRPQHVIDPEEVLGLDRGAWSTVATPANGDIAFMRVQEKGMAIDSQQQIAQVERVQSLMSAAAQKGLLAQLLEEIQAMGALNLEFTKPVNEFPELDA